MEEKKSRAPRTPKAVWVLEHLKSGGFEIANECASTEEAVDWITAQGNDGTTYTVVTVQKEFTVKHETQVKVTLR